MTSSIRLSLEGDEGIPLVARVYPSETDNALPEDMHEVVVPPIGDVQVSVSPGQYLVSLLLPTGRVITKRCDVSAEATEVSFDARGKLSVSLGKQESFSLQGAFSEAGPPDLEQLSQIVARRAAATTALPTVELPLVAAFRPRGNRRGYGTAGRADYGQSRHHAPKVSKVESATFLLMDGSNFREAGGWMALGAGPEFWTKGRTAQLDKGAIEARTILLNVDEFPSGWKRAWLHVAARSGVELGALPMPWTERQPAMVAASFDFSITGRAAMDMAVIDPELAGLLTYLDQGRMSLVPALLRRFETDEFMHRRIHEEPSPLAVCATAYAFLATYSAERAAFWERWLSELTERNSDVPDCHVVLARLRTLMRGVDRSAMAKRSLDAAVSVGVPFLSMGLLMLRDMLVALSQRDPSADSQRDAVSLVARRCDPVRLFTVLRFPEI